MKPFVLVAGPPGSGKSTLARPLAAQLGLSLIAKDVIKEALMDTIGRPGSVEESRELGRAAVVVMLTVARTSPGAVLDSTFYPYTIPYLKALPGPLVEIRCSCPRKIVEARYRARSSTRHAGHLDAQRPPDELWNEHHLQPLGLGPVIRVDTSAKVDIASLAEQVRELAAGAVSGALHPS
jgi:predicted kinase